MEDSTSILFGLPVAAVDGSNLAAGQRYCVLTDGGRYSLIKVTGTQPGEAGTAWSLQSVTLYVVTWEAQVQPSQ